MRVLRPEPENTPACTRTVQGGDVGFVQRLKWRVPLVFEEVVPRAQRVDDEIVRCGAICVAVVVQAHPAQAGCDIDANSTLTGSV